MANLEIIIPEDSASALERLPSEYKVERQGNYYEFDQDGGAWVVFTLGWLASIPASMIATLLLEKLRSGTNKRPSKICINREWVEFEEGAITRRITEQISIEE